jgi:hypothetical protein
VLSAVVVRLAQAAARAVLTHGPHSLTVRTRVTAVTFTRARFVVTDTSRAAIDVHAAVAISGAQAAAHGAIGAAVTRLTFAQIGRQIAEAMRATIPAATRLIVAVNTGPPQVARAHAVAALTVATARHIRAGTLCSTCVDGQR